jgi:alpha-beta hydrolase superfamily lysophospholipase
MARAPHADKTLRVYGGARHEPLFELPLTRRAATDDALGWALARLGGAPPRARL